MSVNFRSLLASLLAFITLVFCPAAFAATAGGQVTLAPSYKQTYMLTTGKFTAAASATDIFEIKGSATKTVKILRVFVLASRSAAGGNIALSLMKRSTANTGGTSTAVTVVPFDSNNAAATCSAKYYTANPTTGTLVGALHYFGLGTEYDASGVGFTGSLYGVSGEVLCPVDFGQAVTLRGTGESLCINANGVSLPNQASITAIVTEE